MSLRNRRLRPSDMKNLMQSHSRDSNFTQRRVSSRLRLSFLSLPRPESRWLVCTDHSIRRVSQCRPPFPRELCRPLEDIEAINELDYLVFSCTLRITCQLTEADFVIFSRGPLTRIEVWR
jgi:hypothetical protein